MLNSILLVDDNKATNFVHKKFIDKANCAKEVVSFQVGHKAIDYLKQLSTYPELIFIDINMPTMNAWEFIEKYNKLKPKGDQESKLILLTTALSPFDHGKIKNYPIIQEVILKPLDNLLIQKIIEKYFEYEKVEYEN